MPDANEVDRLKAALAEIYKLPCECVSCPNCRGLGTIRVDFRTGLPSEGMDDLDELEYCENCRGGVIETCQRCSEAQQLEEEITEEEERNARR